MSDKMIKNFFNLVNEIIPPTRFFALKRCLAKMSGVEVGRNTKIAGRVKFYGHGKISIGSDCWIGIGVSFFSSENSCIYISNNCDIAPDVVFHNGTHILGDRHRRAGKGESLDIRIGNGVWVGVRSVILAGSVIGEGSVVAAGAVVRGLEYGNDLLIGGVPAKVIRKIESE